MEVGRPQVREVTCIGEVACCPYNLLFYLDRVYMIGGVIHLGGLPGLLGRVTLSTGVTICHVNVLRWG